MKKIKKCVFLIVIFSMVFTLFIPSVFAGEIVEQTNTMECEYRINEDYTGELDVTVSFNRDTMDNYIEKLNQEKIVIGITNTKISSLRRNYIQAIQSSGADYVHLSLASTQEEAKALLSQIDALVITGGDDIDPSLYGEEPSSRLETINPERDLSDILMLKEAMEIGMPVLATCRGMQILNIIQGGTLIQDIRTEYDTSVVHRDLSDWDGAYHMINIEQNSQVAKILGATEYEVNSWHHQAIEKLGKGLVVVATAPDGIIEAIEMPENKNIIAVQFHPERTVGEDAVGPQQLGFYYDLIEKAKPFREKREINSFEQESQNGITYYQKTHTTKFTTASRITSMFAFLDQNKAVKTDFKVNGKYVYIHKLINLSELNSDFTLTKLTYTFPYEIFDTNGSLNKDGKTISVTKDNFIEEGKIYAIFNRETYDKTEIAYVDAEQDVIYTEDCYLTINTDNVIENVEITKNGELYKNPYSYINNGIRYNSVYDKFPFTSSGKYVIKSTLVNGTESTLSFIIDRLKPSTNIGSTLYGYDKKITFTDSLSGVKSATLNGKAVKSGTLITESGDYTLIVTDKAGNINTKNFTVDNVNPVTNIDKSYYRTNQTITFSDDFTGIGSATLNDKKISSGKKVSVSGKYKLVITDRAGNKTTKTFTLDKIKPTTNIGETYYKKNKTITFSDSVSGVKKATLNGKKISSGKKVSVSGKYKLVVTDKAGNTRSKTFTVDKVKPVTNMKAKTYKKNQTITFSDKHSGVKKATLNGKKISSGKVVKKNGKYKLVVTDKAGNQKIVKFTIKK